METHASEAEKIAYVPPATPYLAQRILEGCLSSFIRRILLRTHSGVAIFANCS